VRGARWLTLAHRCAASICLLLCKQSLPSEFRQMGTEPNSGDIPEKVIAKSDLIHFKYISKSNAMVLYDFDFFP